MKLLWKLLTDKDNIWVRTITEKYLKEGNILYYNSTKGNSWQFGRLLHLRNIFQTSIGWEVGDGKSIHFWTNRWIPNTLLSQLPNYNQQDKFETVDQYITQEQTWDINKLQQKVPPHIIKLILQIYIPKTQQEDRIIWMPNANGDFTTSSARGHLSNLSSSNHTTLFY